uniref:glycosyltransferase n=1 Tax=Weissella cibaria TaxID=137591 RepID=UPI001897DF32
FVRQDDIDRFIVLTKQQQLDLASEGWLRPEKLVYLPNVACALPVKSQKSDPQPVVNVFTRYNDRQKGLSDFLDKIMPAVVRRVPNVQVNFYGAMYKEEESSVAAPFQQLVRENNLENNVSINDYVDGVTKAKLADESLFTVLPSNYEGMPLAVLEMAKHSVPTIAYDVKYGPAELIQDGVNGYLVDHGDTDTFVNRMVELLQQPKLARYFGDQARKLVLADYQEKSVLSLWQELLGDLTMEMVTTKFDENKAEYVEVTNAMTNTVVRKFSDFETAYVKNSHGTRVLVVEYTTQDEGQRYMHVLNEHESVDMMIAFDQFEKQRFLQAN